MTLGRALTYFGREAGMNLLRSWKTSFLAVTTIAVSLFIGGAFLMLASNASTVVDEWKREAKVVVYLTPGVELPEAASVLAAASDPSWVLRVDQVSAGEGRERFRSSFPSVADLVEGWEEEPLPASFEIAFDPLADHGAKFEEWLRALEELPQVDLVDDDRDWVKQLEVGLRLILSVGLTLGLVLLGAAVFTIASVIRLTAILYQDEIAVMRLVGATEFFIRGPFYMEGLFQGLLGGGVALAALYGGYLFVEPMGAGTLVLGSIASTFLGFGQQVALVAIGGLAGLVGAIVSLRREIV
ncbi:MAG: permease-like cell division protein FtsX [Thermoanaerobaculia bacterium]|nr:permease-like cell division protein FtsX [Thermoanaerobaculia bacterium]